MKLGTIIALGFAVFMAVLAWLVTERLSTESLALLIGVMVGVMATFPAMLLLAYLFTRGDRRRRAYHNGPPTLGTHNTSHDIFSGSGLKSPGYKTPQLPPPAFFNADRLANTDDAFAVLTPDVRIIGGND